MSQYFDMDKDKLKRKFKQCPKQGAGYWMGEHSDRWTCGNCGYTEYKKSKGKK